MGSTPSKEEPGDVGVLSHEVRLQDPFTVLRYEFQDLKIALSTLKKENLALEKDRDDARTEIATITNMFENKGAELARMRVEQEKTEQEIKQLKKDNARMRKAPKVEIQEDIRSLKKTTKEAVHLAAERLKLNDVLRNSLVDTELELQQLRTEQKETLLAMKQKCHDEKQAIALKLFESREQCCRLEEELAARRTEDSTNKSAAAITKLSNKMDSQTNEISNLMTQLNMKPKNGKEIRYRELVDPKSTALNRAEGIPASAPAASPDSGRRKPPGLYKLMKVSPQSTMEKSYSRNAQVPDSREALRRSQSYQGLARTGNRESAVMKAFKKVSFNLAFSKRQSNG